MSATDKQLAGRADKLDAAVLAASRRLIDVETPLVATVVTDLATMLKRRKGDFFPLELEPVFVINIFKSHRLDSEKYSGLKLVPELSSLVVAAVRHAGVVEKFTRLSSSIAGGEEQDSLSFVFVVVSGEDLVHLFNGNQIRSIIALVNRAR